MREQIHPGSEAKVRRGLWQGRIALLLASVSILVFGFSARAAAQYGHARIKTVALESDSIKSYGSSNAPIKMVVYTDYECPSCRALYEETLRPLINDYVAAGKVYLVHRDFPLPMHKYGYQAARWANAAARVGDFANVEAALYDNQPYWDGNGDIAKYVAAAVPSADFKRMEGLMRGCPFQPTPALDASPDQGGHDTCALDATINQDRAIGDQIPIRATPTYMITYKGHKLPAASGVVSWPILKQFFDTLLSH